jgi:DNA gyrase/topoisomerase IV, subunit A
MANNLGTFKTDNRSLLHWSKLHWKGYCGLKTPPSNQGGCQLVRNCLSYRYMPVIPMVLVNGAEGIGTGWSTTIPNYNPRDVVANTFRLLDGEEMIPMQPWYKGFKGTIQEVPSKTAGKSYLITGVITQVGSISVFGNISNLTNSAFSFCKVCQVV